jgi:hypothetical protein
MRESKKRLVPTVEMEDWVSPAEAARLLGVTTSRVRQLSLAGQLPFEQTPLGRIYPRTEIERVAEAKRGASESA